MTLKPVTVCALTSSSLTIIRGSCFHELIGRRIWEAKRGGHANNEFLRVCFILPTLSPMSSGFLVGGRDMEEDGSHKRMLDPL